MRILIMIRVAGLLARGMGTLGRPLKILPGGREMCLVVETLKPINNVARFLYILGSQVKTVAEDLWADGPL